MCAPRFGSEAVTRPACYGGRVNGATAPAAGVATDMRMVSFLASLWFAVAWAALPALAQSPARPQWSRIASERPTTAEGVLTFDLTAARGQWKALRLEVKGGDLTITKIEIHYAGGGRYTETRLIALLEGERTRPLDPGPDRFVDRVVVRYRKDAEPRGELAVEVWGQQSPAAAGVERGRAAPTPPAVAAAPQSREVLIGMQRVTSGGDGFDVGEVGRFARLRLKAHDADVQFERVDVIYADGTTDTIPLDARLAAGAVGPWLDVRPGQFIRRVEPVSRPRPGLRAVARLELTGELAPDWLGPRGPGRDYNGGWVLLGAQTAGFVGFDRDRIPVGTNEGGFRHLRVSVRDRAVTLEQLVVVYASGGPQVIRLGRRIDAGGTFGPVALDPERPIVEIRARYRSRYIDRRASGWRPAIVEVWGQH